MISKSSVFSGWNFMRWLRLAFGIFIGIQALQARDGFSGVIAGFLLFQAIGNRGCCGNEGCEVTPVKTGDGSTKDIEYEEVKTI